ncbi:MAG: DUF2911 domain-containing protein [Melioribacteraceae bacterium]|nr:DUF2911 domain-containing protein [Melioribacteraceae bacterium]
MRFMINKIFYIPVLFLLSSLMQAQPELPRLSPSATAYQKIGTTDVTINYCRPAVKDRKIWGELVPLGKVWRTGANEATTIEFGSDVKLEGEVVKAGRYALFTIPDEYEWTLILNTDADQWGNYNYDKSKDVLRVKLKPEENHFHERMLFQFIFESAMVSVVNLAWEYLKVSFKIESHLSDPESKDVRLSPFSKIKQRVGLTDVTVTYGAPGVKERKIWGELVPYDKIWRAGADEATTFEFSADVKLNGNKVPAGRYSFFTIPSEENWIIILNRTPDQWGAYRYDASLDLMRFEVTPVSSDHPHERLKYGVEDISNNGAVLFLAWEKIKIPIKVDVDTEEQVLKNIEIAVSEKPDDWLRYARAANYALENNIYLDKAMNWVDNSLELYQHYWNNFIKAHLLFKKGDKKNSREFLNIAWNLARKDSSTLKNAEPGFRELEAKLK